MSTLIAILASIIYPILFYFYWTDTPQSRGRLSIRLIRTMYIINTISLLSCCIGYVIVKLQPATHSPQGLRWLYLALAFPAFFIILLRILFLPYVHSTLWTIVYIKYLKKNQFPKKETILFIILLLLSILGLICMEIVSQIMWRA